MKIIEESWEEFRLAIIPLDAPNHQVRDMKIAFYGGATTLMIALTELIKKEGNTTKEEKVEVISTLVDELTNFAEEMSK